MPGRGGGSRTGALRSSALTSLGASNADAAAMADEDVPWPEPNQPLPPKMGVGAAASINARAAGPAEVKASEKLLAPKGA